MSKAPKFYVNPIKAGASPHFREGRVKALPDFLLVNLKRIKPFHDTVRYGYAVGRIRVFETRMINSQRLERLLEADFESALSILDEVAIGDHLRGAKSLKDIDSGLAGYLRGLYSSIEASLPEGSLLIDFFVCRYDFHNLKALLKAWTEESEPQGLLEGLGSIDIDTLRKGIAEQATLPSPFKETAAEFAAFKGDPQVLDTVIDKNYLSHRLFLARREGSPFMIDFARAAIDLANLKQVLRGRLLLKEREFMAEALVTGGFVPVGKLLDIYGDPPEVLTRKLEANIYYSRLLTMAESTDETVRLTDFDRKSDDQLLEMVLATKKISVGVEPVFAFIRASENEVLMVRMILIAKLHNIPQASIEKTLRKLYIE